MSSRTHGPRAAQVSEPGSPRSPRSPRETASFALGLPNARWPSTPSAERPPQTRVPRGATLLGFSHTAYREPPTQFMLPRLLSSDRGVSGADLVVLRHGSGLPKAPSQQLLRPGSFFRPGPDVRAGCFRSGPTASMSAATSRWTRVLMKLPLGLGKPVLTVVAGLEAVAVSTPGGHLTRNTNELFPCVELESCRAAVCSLPPATARRGSTG